MSSHGAEWRLLDCPRIVQDLPLGEAAGTRPWSRYARKSWRVEAINRGDAQPWDYSGSVQLLAETFPRAVLDVLVERDEVDEGYRCDMFRMMRDRKPCPINAIDGGTLTSWAEEKPDVRFPRLAEAMRPWIRINDNAHTDEGVIRGWAPNALRLIDAAPDPLQVLEIFLEKMQPSSWSGSRADIMERRMPLLDELEGNADANIAAWAREAKPRLTKMIEREREWEATRDRGRDERFE